MNTACLVHIVDDDAAVREACAFLMEALGHATKHGNTDKHF